MHALLNATHHRDSFAQTSSRRGGQYAALHSTFDRHQSTPRDQTLCNVEPFPVVKSAPRSTLQQVGRLLQRDCCCAPPTLHQQHVHVHVRMCMLMCTDDQAGGSCQNGRRHRNRNRHRQPQLRACSFMQHVHVNAQCTQSTKESKLARVSSAVRYLEAVMIAPLEMRVSWSCCWSLARCCASANEIFGETWWKVSGWGLGAVVPLKRGDTSDGAGLKVRPWFDRPSVLALPPPLPVVAAFCGDRKGRGSATEWLCLHVR